MQLSRLLLKVYQAEGLSVAIYKLLEYDISVPKECNESFSAICSMAEILRYKIKEIRNDVSKNV